MHNIINYHVIASTQGTDFNIIDVLSCIHITAAKIEIYMNNSLMSIHTDGSTEHTKF